MESIHLLTTSTSRRWWTELTSAFNLSIGSSTAPKIHQAGTRKGKGGRVCMFKAFREENKSEKMDLNDYHRFMLMSVLFKYFKWLKVTPIAVQISAD